jgi:integrase/recombinase XerD
MLSIFRRHLKSCAHRREGRAYRGCRCPVWADGLLHGRDIRESLQTTDWQEAGRIVREREAPAPVAPKDASVTIAAAQAAYISDATARHLQPATIDRHRILFRQMTAFAADLGMLYLKQLDTKTLLSFRESWAGTSALAATKKLERMRTFFKFAVSSGYIETNPAAPIKNPTVKQNPTLPFSHKQMQAILTAAAEGIAHASPQGRNRARRLRALVLFLRYTGLRISDAVGADVDRLQNGKLFLYTQKTGTPVSIPLPAFVVAELEAIPRVSETKWFCHPGTTESCRKKWSESLADLFKCAGVKGHAHQFRDSFAVELLLAGTPIERVSILLGHSSVRITEKHYSPWNRARQDQTEADVRRSWAQDPTVLLEGASTAEGTYVPQ